MRTQSLLPLLGIGSLLMSFSQSQAGEIRRVGSNAETGSSRAVVVTNETLLHTAQMLPDKDSSGDVSSQAQLSLERVLAAVAANGGDRNKLVKLNVYVARNELVPAVQKVLAKAFSAGSFPAVSFVTTVLPGNQTLVAMDGIAVGKAADSVTIQNGVTGALPQGSRIYIAGQAEKGSSLAEATRKTLESLERTLQFMGRGKADIVQLKSFLSPMADVAEVDAEMKRFFGDLPVPPTVNVEWKAPLIEIELIAWGGPTKSSQPVEYLTPPGMTASPVYSRVARTHSSGLIYVSGLYARDATDAAGEVTGIFEQLQGVLKETGSDLRHLVKATYYCSHNDTSTKLNELRPNYYDPARPPAASKAMVAGVGAEGLDLTIDMIAVPTGK